MRTLDIAIATYNRPTMTISAFEKVHDDPRVARVAISDDGSEWEGYQDLTYRASMWTKATVSRNEHNTGSWANKRRAVGLCSADWVALIDSDNVIGPEYLDVLDALPEWDPDTIYLPVRGTPVLNYERYAGTVVDRSTVARWLLDPVFQMALNTGNFFVHRANHLLVSDGAFEDPYASDGIYFIYQWLASGRRALITPGLSYEHLVHNGHWTQTAGPSTVFANELIRRMLCGEWERPCAA